MFFRKKNIPKKFIILFVRGGGSTFLAELINQMQGFVCFREPALDINFLNQDSLRYLKKLQRKDDKKFRKTETNRFDACRWVGAKVKLYDQVSDTFLEGLLNSSIPLIFLIRRDTLRHAVGLCRKDMAAQSVVWSETEKLPPVRIPIPRFKETLNWLNDRNRELIEFGNNFDETRAMTITYEDLCRQPKEKLCAITQFLGEKNVDINIKKKLLPVKHTSVGWENDVLNTKEITTCFHEIKND